MSIAEARCPPRFAASRCPVPCSLSKAGLGLLRSLPSSQHGGNAGALVPDRKEWGKSILFAAAQQHFQIPRRQDSASR